MIAASFAYLTAIILLRLYYGVRLFGAVISDPLFLWLALFAFFVGGLLTVDWLIDRATIHVRDIGYARNYGKIALANVIRGLNPNQLDYMRIHGTEIRMLTSGREPIYTIRCSGSMDLDRDFMADFLRESLPTWPYLFPVRDAKTNGVLSKWESAELNATIATNHMVKDDEIADPASGNKTAKIKDQYTFMDVCRKYGIKI